MAYPLSVYISYSKKDSKTRDQLRTGLVTMERQGLISVWDDERLIGGDRWLDEIHQKINDASVILMIVTPDYLASKFITDVEMPIALKKSMENGVRVIPIIYKRCDWVNSPLAMLKVLPKDGKPVNEWRNRAKALEEIRETIRIVAYDMPQVLSISHGSERVNKGESIMARDNGRTLIIHGHADKDRLELSEFIHDSLNLPKPIVMKNEMTPGMSLPEKFATLADRVEFAVALLTPDDEGKALGEQSFQPRARQNTLVEIGWFWGRLGLGRVLLLVKGKIDIPTDLQGLEYYQYSISPIECSEKIRSFYKAHNVPLR